MTDELAALRDENFKLKCALYDVISMERTVTPDMSGKRRAFAYMRNGQVLAECIDRGWELLGYDWSPTDPAHGGKIMTHENQKDELMIRIATAIYTVAVGAGSEGYKVEDFYPEALVAIDGVRAYDREQRAKIDAALAPKPEALDRHNSSRHGGMSLYVETRRDPDDYRDLHLVTRVDRAPGIREG